MQVTHKDKVTVDELTPLFLATGIEKIGQGRGNNVEIEVYGRLVQGRR